MIVRQKLLRLGQGGRSLFQNGHQIRSASVSPHFTQSHPERPPRTDYFGKYQKQLQDKAKAEGVSTVSELRERYQSKIQGVKKKMDSVPAKIGFRQPPQKPQSTTTATPVMTLSSYVDVDKLRKHTDTKEIELIWRAGHTKDTLICAVIPSPIYDRIKAVAKDHPMFILPLARDGGIEMHFMQFTFAEANVTHLLFTSLLEYKTHGEFARPHTTVMHFEDLAGDKGIVLMRGEVDAEQKRVVGLEEARSLVMHVQKLYGADPESERGRIRRRLIEGFSRGSPDFDVTRLMDELNRID